MTPAFPTRRCSELVGKAASRRADVDRGRARYVPAQMHPPMFQRVIELDAAARHPRMVAALDADRGIGGDRLPRLVDLAVADEGEAREDQRLRPRPAFGEPALDQQLVGALLCPQTRNGVV